MQANVYYEFKNIASSEVLQDSTYLQKYTPLLNPPIFSTMEFYLYAEIYPLCSFSPDHGTFYDFATNITDYGGIDNFISCSYDKSTRSVALNVRKPNERFFLAITYCIDTDCLAFQNYIFNIQLETNKDGF